MNTPSPSKEKIGVEVGADFKIHGNRRKGTISINEMDGYNKIWLCLKGIDIEKPVNIVKRNGDRLFDQDYIEHLPGDLSHESIHQTIINLEGAETSARYDLLYHYKGAWWLP